jgi:hypothetical protein
VSRHSGDDHREHLSEAELFGLAVPPAGEPEALPGHLSECLSCSRALLEWKAAVRDLADEGADAIASRCDEEWEALEQKTIAAIRRSRLRRHQISWRWMATVAAALLLFALLLPLRRGATRPAAKAPTASAPSGEMSAQDQADDALLRDVARLSRGDESVGDDWGLLVPDPDGNGGVRQGKL